MKNRRLAKMRLWVEELETRVVPSAAPTSLLHTIAATSTVSTNWSGYASLTTPQNPVTAVSGSWVVPTVSGSGTAYSSFWVGIDGYNSNTVEQIGTDSDVVNGVARYYAWYEMYPYPSYTISSITVNPGDTINASVTYANSKFSLSLTDVHNGTSTSTPALVFSAPGAQRTSAEWIAEAPSSNRGVLPLASFSPVQFSNASAIIGGTTGPIDTWQNASINMVTSNGAPLDATSNFADTTTSPATSSFLVTYTGAVSTTPPSGGGHHHHSGSGSSGSGWGWGSGWHATLNGDGSANASVMVPIGAQLMRSADPNIAVAGNAAPAPTFHNTLFQADSSSWTAIARLSSSGVFDVDLPDALVPPHRWQEGPAVRPLPNRDMPPAVAPMPQDTSSRQESETPILDVPAVAPETSDVASERRSAGLLKALVSLIGGVGAFALFGNAANHATPLDERNQQPRKRTR
jgi:hypothetical protein